MLKRIAVAVVAVALVGASDAAAQATKYPSEDATKYPSTITFDIFECVENCNTKGPLLFPQVITGGDVDSDKNACVANRRVLIVPFEAIEGEIDVDRTSNSGAWSGRGSIFFPEVDHVVAKVKPKWLNPHRLCQAATAHYFLDA